MTLSIKKYIAEVVRRKAKIGYDKSVGQWYGILHHAAGSIYSQRKTKAKVKKELAEVLEEFIARYLKENTGQTPLFSFWRPAN